MQELSQCTRPTLDIDPNAEKAGAGAYQRDTRYPFDAMGKSKKMSSLCVSPCERSQVFNKRYHCCSHNLFMFWMHIVMRLRQGQFAAFPSLTVDIFPLIVDKLSGQFQGDKRWSPTWVADTRGGTSCWISGHAQRRTSS
jgi:hypothetical protein